MESRKRAIRTFGKLLNVGYFLGFHSSYWNKKRNFFQHSPARARRFIFQAHAIFANSYIIFLLFRVIHNDQTGGTSIESRGHVVYLFLIIFIENIIFIFGSYLNYQTLHAILQFNMDFVNNFKSMLTIA